MIELEKLSEHIESITPDKWYTLFELLPEMERTKKYSELKGGEKIADKTYLMPYIEPSEIVSKFHTIIYKLDLVPVFDWSVWEEGRTILKDEDYDFNQLDIITLCKLLTVIVRADRFNEGFLVSNFENGIVPKIINAIKEKVY